ncbi:hypothetical protein [Streptomyces xanthophaeus]
MAESHQVLLVSFTDRQASRAGYQEALALPGLRGPRPCQLPIDDRGRADSEATGTVARLSA